MANSTRDGIKHRIREANRIEKMPFLNKNQSVYDHNTGNWYGTLSESDRIAKNKWFAILDERLAMLGSVDGDVKLNRAAALGKKTTC